MWAAKFYFCEFLNFVNIIVQVSVCEFLATPILRFGRVQATDKHYQD